MSRSNYMWPNFFSNSTTSAGKTLKQETAINKNVQHTKKSNTRHAHTLHKVLINTRQSLILCWESVSAGRLFWPTVNSMSHTVASYSLSFSLYSLILFFFSLLIFLVTCCRTCALGRMVLRPRPWTPPLPQTRRPPSSSLRLCAIPFRKKNISAPTTICGRSLLFLSLSLLFCCCCCSRMATRIFPRSIRI